MHKKVNKKRVNTIYISFRNLDLTEAFSSALLYSLRASRGYQFFIAVNVISVERSAKPYLSCIDHIQNLYTVHRETRDLHSG